MRLPQLEKIMVIGKTEEATHERIGPVSNVKIDGDWVYLSGDYHNSKINLSLISKMVVDTSSVMKDRTFPRIDFMNDSETNIFSIVGFEGLEVFERGLESFAHKELQVATEKPVRNERPPVSEDDQGKILIEGLQKNAEDVSISFGKTGFDQQWSGIIEKTSMGMGFINIMTEDFHLHLPGGSVASWDFSQNGDLAIARANNSAGAYIGLQITSQNINAFQ